MSFAPEFFASARRRWRRLDRVVRAMIVNWAVGMGVGASCAALLLAIDFAGLRSLLWRSDIAVVGTIMLVAAFAFTFGGLVAAAAAMRIGQDDDDEPRGGRRARVLTELTPVRVTRTAR